MGISLKSLDAVIVGRFNPHIITPPWLQKQKICDSSVQVKMEMGFDMENRQGIVNFTIDDVRWHVTDRRLTLSCDSSEGNPAQLAASVLRVLLHTPVSAIGHNFHYRCDLAQWGGRLPQIGGLDRDKLTEHGTPILLSWSGVFEQAGVRCGINVQQHKKFVEVDTNFHRDATSVEEVGRIADGFCDDMTLSGRLVGSVTGVEVV